MLAVTGTDDGALQVLVFTPRGPVAKVDGRQLTALAKATIGRPFPCQPAIPCCRRIGKASRLAHRGRHARRRARVLGRGPIVHGVEGWIGEIPYDGVGQAGVENGKQVRGGARAGRYRARRVL